MLRLVCLALTHAAIMREDIAMGRTTSSPLAMLLNDGSLEMTAKDVEKLAGARPDIPAGHASHYHDAGQRGRRHAACCGRSCKGAGVHPSPAHLGAAGRLGGCAGAVPVRTGRGGLSERVFVVGGRTRVPLGSFPDSLTIIRSGVLKTYGVEDIGTSGHPAIPECVLWSVIEGKIVGCPGTRSPARSSRSLGSTWTP
jgi:methylenetetrahydrofolate reductase (NADPH)